MSYSLIEESVQSATENILATTVQHHLDRKT